VDFVIGLAVVVWRRLLSTHGVFDARDVLSLERKGEAHRQGDGKNAENDVHQNHDHRSESRIIGFEGRHLNRQVFAAIDSTAAERKKIRVLLE